MAFLSSLLAEAAGRALGKYTVNKYKSRPRKTLPFSPQRNNVASAYTPSPAQSLINKAITIPGATSSANSLKMKSSGTPIASLDSTGRAIRPNLTPSSVNTAISSSPSASAYAPSGYTSSDPSVQAKIAQMQQQAVSRSSYGMPAAPTAPTAPTSPQKSFSMAGLSDPSFVKKLAQDNLAKLQEQYLSTLTPSERERALQGQLTDYVGNANLGISNVEGQGRLIPLGLVRGTQAKLQEQANIGAQTIQGQLDNELANRTAQGQVYGTQLGFEQERIQNEQQQNERAQDLQLKLMSSGFQQVDPSQVTDPNSVVQIGGNTYLKPSSGMEIKEVDGALIGIMPDGTVQELYRSPAAGGESYTLSPGQVRYDAYGNELSAVSAGAEGGFTLGNTRYDAYGNPIVTNNTSGTQSAEMLKLQANVKSGLDSLAVIQSSVTSGGSLLGGFAGSLFNQKYTTAKSNLTDIIGRLRSGGAITADEEKRFNSLIPNPRDSAENAQYKVDQLQSLLSNTLSQQEQSYVGGGQDNPLDLNLIKVGADTNQGSVAIKAVEKNYPVGSIGRQCGRFVNRLTGLRMGDTYQSKMVLTNSSIKIPQSGDFFVMPYSWTGHTGLVQRTVLNPDGSLKGIYAYDSNWGEDERVRLHFIAANNISAYGRTPITTKKVSLA